MNTFKPCMKPAAILLGMLIALPMAAIADKGGKPNPKSAATTAACIDANGDAQVYSCKGLSNVVLWCGTTYVKHDDIEDEEGNEIFEGVFGCVDADGDAIEGDITYISVKSGSQKHVKHNNNYSPPDGLPTEPPSGSGLFIGGIPECPLAEIPQPGNCLAPVDPGA